MLAIETTGLTKRYGGTAVVDDVALRVPERCVYGFLGPNGAGKTTVMRLLLGLLRADAGTIRLLGHALDARRAILAEVGAFVESPGLYDHLSGRTNLELTCRLRGVAKREVDRVLEAVDMRHAADMRAATCSLGMQQRLALARALIGAPRLLLLDEPTNGLDPDGIIAMRTLIRELPERIGGTVFVSSHLLAEVEQVASVAGLMRAGKLVLQGEIGSLIGTGRTVRFVLDDPARAVARLGAAGFAVSAIDSESVRLACPAAELRAAAAEATRLLVEAGVAVSAVVPEARTLEDVYRSAAQPAIAA